MKKNISSIEKVSYRVTNWIGTPMSVVFHSLVFAIAITLLLMGVDFAKVILILNTAVSLEAIYLAIFIQMTVNRQTESLEGLEEEFEEISEDIEEEELKEIRRDKELDHLELGLHKLMQEVEALKTKETHRKVHIS